MKLSSRTQKKTTTNNKTANIANHEQAASTIPHVTNPSASQSEIQYNMAVDKPSVKEAQALASTDPRKAEAIYKTIISKAPSVTSEAAIKEYETGLISLGELYRDEK